MPRTYTTSTLFWLAVFGAPVLWLIGLEFNYLFGNLACRYQSKVPLIVVGIVIAAAVAWCLAYSWSTYHRPRAEDPTPETGVRPFLTELGMGLGLFIGLSVLAGIVPIAALSVCF